MKLNSEDFLELATLDINAILRMKIFCFERKMKSQIKLNSEDLLEFASLEINAMWKIQYFFWYCLNTKVFKFNNFKIGIVNAFQKKFVFAFIYSYFGFHLPAINPAILLLQKHLNNNSQICRIRSFTCFEQHFQDWFSVLRYNSGLTKTK